MVEATIKENNLTPQARESLRLKKSLADQCTEKRDGKPIKELSYLTKEPNRGSLANEKLVMDIINRLGNNGRFPYPRYLLIDENGKVVNGQASYA